MTVFRRARELAIDALFPARCVGCGSFGSFICDPCVETAPLATGDRCPKCWLAAPPRLENLGYVVEGRGCQDCERHAPAFTGLRSAFVYRDVARAAVLSLKFEGVSAIAPRMASLMAEVCGEWAPPVEAIVPVPLGWMRRRTRGYNQSELLAGEISRVTELPVERRALRRRRQTSPQARQRDAVSRRENMRAAFEAGSRPVSGSVLLIDDVATTGATLDACAQVLLGAGASEVYALTFARED